MNRRSTHAILLVLLLLVGAWPHLYVLPLWPESRDAVIWVTRGAVSNPGWSGWVFLHDHFIGYRPVTALSYTLDSVVGGFAAFPYRATDIAVHLGSGAALYMLARRLAPTLPAWGALVAAALFVAHPASAEVVPHLARRAYSLCTLFSLVGLSVLAGPPSLARALVAAVLLALGALSNEAGYAAFVVAGVMVALQWSGGIKLRAIATIFGVAVLIVLLRIAVLGDVGGYAVERGDRWMRIVAALGTGVLGVEASRIHAPVLARWVPPYAVLFIVTGLAVPFFIRPGKLSDEARASLLGWVWIVTLLLLFAPQGVYFPRQVYVVAAPFALLVGLAAATTSLERGLSRLVLVVAAGGAALAVLSRSPVLIGPDPALRECWVRHDRLVRDLDAAVSRLDKDVAVLPVIPYYARPEVEALRARDDEEIRDTSRQALAWVTALRGTKFLPGVLIPHDARNVAPTARLVASPEGTTIEVPPGAELVAKGQDVTVEVGENGVRVITPAVTDRGRAVVLYFHDGLTGRIVPIAEPARGAYTEAPTSPDDPTVLVVERDEADGMLVGATFHDDGADDVNRAQVDGSSIVLRFAVPQGMSSPLYARLDLPVVARAGEGPLEVVVRGVVDNGAGWSEKSASLTTEAAVHWTGPVPWPDPNAGLPRVDERKPLVCAPFQRFTPDLSPLIAEALARGATHLSFRLDATRGTLLVQDSQSVEDAECPGRLAPRLELYPTLRSTFVGKELSSRPTDRAVTLSLMSVVDVEVSIDVGTTEAYGTATPTVTASAGTPVHIVIDQLPPNALSHYRVRARRPGATNWELGPDRTVHTQRTPGSSFSFTVTSDSHYLNMKHRRDYAAMHLLSATMDRVAREGPDFHLDLGDTFHTESYSSYDAPDDEEALRRHLAVRPLFERVDAPLLVAIGNHEGEQGWRYVVGDPVAARATRIRKLLFPNPFPDGFYSGNEATEPDLGRPENYYAFRWGDVLFVVLDPYRYTTRKPHDVGGEPGTGSSWDWTLGKTQADWLARTLENSDAPFKLVLAHQLTGGTSLYGRGGREAATSSGELGSEWRSVALRPGWQRPIHQVLADSGVTAFVHGHDHQFVFEPPLDGVTYITVPQPGDPTYHTGFDAKLDPEAIVLPNAGHLLFEVESESLRVSYVRSYLPGDGPDGEVAFTRTWSAP